MLYKDFSAVKPSKSGDVLLSVCIYDFYLFIFFLHVYSSGPDTAATDAGQVPDYVGPDHWKEYPYLKPLIRQKDTVFH